MNETRKNLLPDPSVDIFTHSITSRTTYYANLLRRTMMSDVPTLAIDSVSIEHNDSVLIDELISHRLGLVVLKSDNIPEDQVVLSLNITCKEEWMYVTTGMFVSSHDDVYPVNPNTIIVRLNRGETLKLSGIVREGTGRQHAKWMPVSAIGYKLMVVDDHYEITMKIESVGSLSAKAILDKAKIIISENYEPTGFTKYKTAYLKAN